MSYLKKELLSRYTEQLSNRKKDRQSVKERMSQRKIETEQINETYFKKTNTLNRLRNK